jgi:hypothetical protein
MRKVRAFLSSFGEFVMCRARWCVFLSLICFYIQDSFGNDLRKFPLQDSTRANTEGCPISLSGGGVLFVWSDSTAIWCSRSTDLGLSWGTANQIITPNQSADFLSGLRTATGRLLIAWVDSGLFKSASSDDEGVSWQLRSGLSGGSSRSISLSKLPDSSLWIVWRAGLTLFRTVSRDNGETWTTAQQLMTGSWGEGTVFSTAPGIVRSIVCLQSSNAVLQQSLSTNGGTNWSTPAPIFPVGYQMMRPRVLALGGDSLLLTYLYRERDPLPDHLQANVYSSLSTDGGVTWGNPVALTRYSGDDLGQALCTTQGKAFLTFSSDRGRTRHQNHWFGIVGESTDMNPPPYVMDGYFSHRYGNIENRILSIVDDESGVREMRLVYRVNAGEPVIIQLYDDGLHSDGGVGDASWGNVLDAFPSQAFIEWSIVAEDSGAAVARLDGVPFTSLESPILPTVQGTRMTLTYDSTGTFGSCVWPTGISRLGLEYPAGSGIEHLFAGGLWVGGKVDTSGTGSGDRMVGVTTAYEGWSGPYKEFSSRGGVDSIWKVFGRNAAKPAGWDEYWEGSLPYTPIADQNFFNQYFDNDRHIARHTPLGVKVIQSSYSWDDPGMSGIHILEFRIINVSSASIDSVFVGMFIDGDVGPVGVANYGDRNYSAFRQADRMAFIHNPADAGSTPLGVSVLNTHFPMDSLDFTYWWYPGSSSPTNDTSRYSLMRLNRIKDPQFPDLSDTRFVLAHGPYHLPAAGSASADTIIVAYAFLSAPTIQGLSICAGVAREVYSGSTGVGGGTTEKPFQFFLDQNYPNPFNPATTIRVGIAESGPATLEVFDILGRRVAQLFHEHKSRGTYAVTLDGSKLASGVYMIQLRSGRQIMTRKALLLK